MGTTAHGRLYKGTKCFHATTICASLQSRNTLPVIVTSWDTRKDGRTCWRGKQGREMERKRGEAIEEEGKHMNMGFMLTIKSPKLLTIGQRLVNRSPRAQGWSDFSQRLIGEQKTKARTWYVHIYLACMHTSGEFLFLNYVTAIHSGDWIQSGISHQRRCVLRKALGWFYHCEHAVEQLRGLRQMWRDPSLSKTVMLRGTAVLCLYWNCLWVLSSIIPPWTVRTCASARSNGALELAGAGLSPCVHFFLTVFSGFLKAYS